MSSVSDAVKAFRAHRPKTVGNTKSDGEHLYLHKNMIAKWQDGDLWITTCGWDTVTTRSRLNELPIARIYHYKGQLYFKGYPWGGEWINTTIQPKVDVQVHGEYIRFVEYQIGYTILQQRKPSEYLAKWYLKKYKEGIFPPEDSLPESLQSIIKRIRVKQALT